MKTEVNTSTNRLAYMSEYSYWYDNRFVTFNIVCLDTDKSEITVAITDEGRISVRTFDLYQNKECLYFEYGVMYEKIAVDAFEQIEEE